jgi:arylsulfatase A-like enzyme
MSRTTLGTPVTFVLAALLLAPLSALQAADAPKTAGRPNIVYLLADQLRASATGYAGDPNVKTPNLDRLAKEGLRFRNAVSVCPVCTPYRAALMTGRYPTSTGMFLNDAHLPQSELCLAEVLRAAGYATAYIGKWHLDGHGRSAYIPPERRRGWDYWKAAECDHSYNHSHYYAGNSDVMRFWEGYDAFAQTRDAQQYIRDHARGPQPFVLLVSYGVPHFPHATAPEPYKALYPPEKIKLPPNVPQEMQAKARQEAQGYYAHCTALDKCVGDVLQTLGETGIAENTIVVFTSDHGEMLGSHGCPPTMKQVPWDESAHVPFLLRYPAIHGRQGRIVNLPLTTPDIFPTLLGLAGVEVPRTVEGDDLSPLMREGRDARDRAALYMNVAPFVAREFAKEYRAIRTSRYTYVRGLDGPWLLFDDETDPYQMDNLVAKPQYAALRKELDQRLQDRLKKIGDDFRSGRSYITEWGYEVALHGSVPYSTKAVKPQTPKRKPL